MNEGEILNKELLLNQKKEQSFIKLQKIAQILKEMGLRVIDHFISKDCFKESIPFPIVRDGADGIRAVYERGEIKIFFTNGFEDPKNTRRQEVEIKLKEAGIF